jgi:hypothetical protein
MIFSFSLFGKGKEHEFGNQMDLGLDPHAVVYWVVSLSLGWTRDINLLFTICKVVGRGIYLKWLW